jgi:hypothetical protein
LPLVILLRRLLPSVLLAAGLAAPAAAEPGKVTVGTYINKIQEIDFKEGKFKLDFYIWFRWEAFGVLADYQPLQSMELMNGHVEKDDVTSKVEKPLSDFSRYASARITATIYKNWELKAFPLDRHPIEVQVEDSRFVADALQFEPDLANSKLGDEVDLPGWRFSCVPSKVESKQYKTNYGDTTLPPDSVATYSRLTFGMDMQRTGWGQAIKLLGAAIIATLVAFVAFGIRPTDVDPRFGLGVGALFAVVASSFIVASAVPDSSVLTIADRVHIVAMWFIFASLVQSTLCLRWDEAGLKMRSKRVDRWSIVLFPALFLLWTGGLVAAGLFDAERDRGAGACGGPTLQRSISGTKAAAEMRS